MRTLEVEGQLFELGEVVRADSYSLTLKGEGRVPIITVRGNVLVFPNLPKLIAIAKNFPYDGRFITEKIEDSPVHILFYVLPCGHRLLIAESNSSVGYVPANYMDFEPFSEKEIKGRKHWFLLSDGEVIATHATEELYALHNSEHNIVGMLHYESNKGVVYFE